MYMNRTQPKTPGSNPKQEPSRKQNKHKPPPAGSILLKPLATPVHNRRERNSKGQLRTTRNNDEQQGTTASNDEQQGTTTNNALPYPPDSPLLSSAVALSLISHSMATSASSSRFWMLCASRDTSRLPISIVGRRGIAGWSSDEA